jgi:hypothetical protein
VVKKTAVIAAVLAAVLVLAFAGLCWYSQQHVLDKDGMERNPDRYPLEQVEPQKKGSAEALPFLHGSLGRVRTRR